jgi:DNA-binding CsgD family transcriptional regulator
MPGIRLGSYTRGRVLERIERLASEGMDVRTFLSAAGAELARAVPFDADVLPNPAWVMLDPASLLATSLLQGDQQGWQCEMSTPEWARFEYASGTVGNRISDVVRHPRGIQTATEVAHAHPNRAEEYREVLTSIGAEHEVLVALQAGDGAHWGAVYVTREPGRPDFVSEELEFLRLVAPRLADGVRRGLLLGEASEPEGPGAPAIVVLGPDLEPESVTPGAEHWLTELPAPKGSSMPPVVLAVAQAALSARGVDRRGQPASARVRSEGRGWVMLHGQALTGNGDPRVAITIQPAGPDRITPLLMAAYGLTKREEEVTRHVLQGSSTAEIATALTISPYTVQDHLKNVFEKTSVRSRRELAGRIFARHYEPRVEDNTQRVELDKPIRGGPFPNRPAVSEPSVRAGLDR